MSSQNKKIDLVEQFREQHLDTLCKMTEKQRKLYLLNQQEKAFQKAKQLNLKFVKFDSNGGFNG